MHRQRRQPSAPAAPEAAKAVSLQPRPRRPARLNLALIPDSPAPRSSRRVPRVDTPRPVTLPPRFRSQPLPFALPHESPVALAGLEWCLDR